MSSCHNSNILQLLHKRERYGVRNENTIRFSNIPSRSNSRVHCRDLSIVSAWNPKRLQNMILAVGPLTPAFVLNPSARAIQGEEEEEDSNSSSSSSSHSSDNSNSSSNSSSNGSSGSDRHNDNLGQSLVASGLHRTTASDVRAATVSRELNNEEEEEEEEEEGKVGTNREDVETTENVDEFLFENLSGQKRMSHQNSDGDASTDAEENNQDAGGGGPSNVQADRVIGDMLSSSSSLSSSASFKPLVFFPSQYKPAISHSGCINTASWMDCSWRLSAVKCYDEYPRLDSFIISSTHSSNSNMVSEMPNPTDTSSSSPVAINCSDCPTQIVTSGDDRIVKFWDCSQSMGSASPVPGRATNCPFAYCEKTTLSSYCLSSRAKRWRKDMDDTAIVPGLVQFLASMRTGHRGNVFHASPLARKPGQVMTCAADGKLDVCDIVQDSISTILTLDGMLFSHVMLDEHIGLVCGESGLHRFDLRVPRSSQPSSSILGPREVCKSCAVYSASEAETSAYVFAGRSSQVELYDLRFLSDSARTIQTFQPSCFSNLEDVSVSGIDVSKDRKELLVSYESDQIYTFPLFPSHITDPTTDDMISYSNNVIENPHFGGYGAHLNRFTFLKCAKYAGPNDEYICTGSDSGHAFIYEKNSGSVVSMLKADNSTCNGVVPHPMLPFFLTYGIDSTAKLWRASNPVDDNYDDSGAGRRRALHEQEYNKSTLVSRCSDVQAYLNKTASDPDLKDMAVTLLPDEVVLRSININGRVFDGLPEILFRSLFRTNPFNPGSDEICNDLRSLPEVLRSNYYEAINAIVEDDEVPVRCGMTELHRRISLIRLFHQSHQTGIRIDPERPWNLRSICHVVEGRDDDSISPADLIPDSPSDWLPYDYNFSGSILEGGRALVKDDREDFYYTRYCRFSNTDRMTMDDSNLTKMEETSPFDASKAWDVLLETVTTLKEEGNTALQQGSVHLAARLYDKALAYCCAAFFNYPQSNLDFLSSHQKLLSKNAGHCTLWSPLLKAFISVRLNLSMTLLKPGIADIDAAHSQAYLALQDLRPFTKKAGMVLTGKRLQKTRQDEPMQTFQEAKELEAKAYFRLGSVKMQGRQYTSAMHMFEKCLQATKEYRPNSPPDRTIQSRLAEAKRLSEKERKKRRKQFRFAFGDDGSSEKDGKADHENKDMEL